MAILKDKHVNPPSVEAGPCGALPALVTATWSPFCAAAKNFWQEAGGTVGLPPLRVVDAESEEGAQLIVSFKIAGVPCLILARDRLVYGVELDKTEAESFFQSQLIKSGE